MLNSLRSTSKKEYEDAIAAGKPLPLLPLCLAMECVATEVEVNTNVYATLDRGYIPFNEHLSRYSGTVSLVGSGPSISHTYRYLRGDVCAINSALKFLLSKGIVPKWAMIWDAVEIASEFAIPHPDVTYLIASRCNPKVFEKLKGCKVVVWHAAGDYNIVELMNRPEVIAKQKVHEPLIHGGTAGVTRGIFLVGALGYNDIHVFGGDSCYRGGGDKTHVRGSVVPEKDIVASLGDRQPIFFRTTPEWCAQIEEYKQIYLIYEKYKRWWGTKLTPHGSGMLQTLHKLLVKQKRYMGKKRFLKEMDEVEKERLDRNKAFVEEYEKDQENIKKMIPHGVSPEAHAQS